MAVTWLICPLCNLGPFKIRENISRNSFRLFSTGQSLLIQNASVFSGENTICAHENSFSTRRNFARGATFSVRLKKLNCFRLCYCTILAENDAPRAKFLLVQNRLRSIKCK